MNTHARADIGIRHSYFGFEHLPIGGEWRRGRMDHALKDLDPYTGKVILEIPEADRNDLEDAYAAAARPHDDWASELPSTRGEKNSGIGRFNGDWAIEAFTPINGRPCSARRDAFPGPRTTSRDRGRDPAAARPLGF